MRKHPSASGSAERVRGLDWDALSKSPGALSRDMEIFYPANRFINFYIVPLTIERRADADEKSNGAAEPVGHAMILRDITESRRSTQQTIESERFNALTLLAAGVAHEIGNPLNSLHIHLQLMERKVRELKGKQRKELQESIDIARSEITRLDSIVTQFLRAIRPSKPQLHPGKRERHCRRNAAFLCAGDQGPRHRGRSRSCVPICR